RRLSTADADFGLRFGALLADRAAGVANVDAAVAEIVADVRDRGDAALLDYTARFDRLGLTPATLRVTGEEIEAASAGIDPATMEALRLARDRIDAHHRRQVPADDRYTDALGVTLGTRWT